MAAAAMTRAMAQQSLHPFFARQSHVHADDDRTAAENVPSAFSTGQCDRRTRDSSAITTGLEQGLNEERRKRRRTASPAVVPTLRGVGLTSERTSEAVVSCAPIEHSNDRVPANEVVVKNAESPEYEDDEHAPAVASGDVAYSAQTQLKKAPSTKVLRLRTDGRLKSPGIIEGDGCVRKTRKRRSGGKRGKHLVLRYGRTPHERLTIGRKIEQIVSGKIQVEIKQPKSLLPITKTEVAHELTTTRPKETHPFFMGTFKKAQSGGDPSKADTSETDCNQMQFTSGPKPKPSTVTSLGTSFAKVPKIPGVLEAIWPPAGMQHVRGDVSGYASDKTSVAQTTEKKAKGRQAFVPLDEEVYRPQHELVRIWRGGDLRADSRREFNARIRKPDRLLLTGKRLQRKLGRELQVRRRIGTAGYGVSPSGSSSPDTINSSQTHNHLTSAASHLFSRIETSFCAFDRFECDNQAWCHKYAPTCVEEILQDQVELALLRDWLRTRNVSQIDKSAASGQSKHSAIKQLAAKRRKRKAKEELDGFIVSGSEDSAPTTGVTEPNDGGSSAMEQASCTASAEVSTLKRLRPTNLALTRAVLLSGPHGCGKTASIYTIAAELGFEIFEINSGSRRNGRDILDRVGDMTKNHLVRRGGSQDALLELKAEDAADAPVEEDLDTKQQSMTSFFAPKMASQPSKKGRGRPKQVMEEKTSSKPSKQQKQSLILIEEVDVLFEEDKPFWSTVFTLIMQSRRPIIMTCTDEQSLPLEDFVDSSVLRLSARPADDTIDYLLCLVANEGHLVSRPAISHLVASRGGDLRASLMELQFWCQMAIGDDKCGIGWFMDANEANAKRSEADGRLRIVSEGTFPKSDELLERKQGRKRTLDYEARLLAEFTCLSGCIESEMSLGGHATLDATNESRRSWEMLKSMDLCYDALSATDTFPFASTETERQDVTQPEISAKVRSSYVDSYPLLQTDSLADPSGLGPDIGFAMKACARHVYGLSFQPLQWRELISAGLEPMVSLSQTQKRLARTVTTALEPLTEPTDGYAWLQSRGQGISVLDGPCSIIASEVAPIVRSVARSDLRLEEERQRLSSLMDKPGRKSKSTRTTRAARAALEGGSKASTRKERWFSKKVDYRAVLATGGADWPDPTAESAVNTESMDCNPLDVNATPASSLGSRRPSTDISADEVA